MSIKVINVSKNYGDQVAVNSLSFEVKKGEIVGFLGPNGAGKSTTIKIITGYINSSKGEVFVGNQKVQGNKKELHKIIGYLPEQNPLYTEMYVKEYLSFIASIHQVSKDKIIDVIHQTGLGDEISKKLKHLSKGFKQRVGLAAAIIHNPEVLILDEPTTGLDPNQILEIRTLIKSLAKNKTILLSTHLMQEVEAVCDRVIILNKGVLKVDANLQELKSGETQTLLVTFNYKIEEQFVKKIQGVTACKNVYNNEWELQFDTKEDKTSVVFDFAQAHGLKILQLRTQNKSLEYLFAKYTK